MNSSFGTGFVLNRRGAMACCIGMIAAKSQSAWASPPDPSSQLAAIERRHGGRLGVFATDVASGRGLGHRADERFKLMSSFKGLLTAMVLHEVAIGSERLDAVVRFDRDDLMAASPVTTAAITRGGMSVGELCAAAMARSDNAAANLLLRRLGGPSALTTFLRGLGDSVTRVDHGEGPLLAAAPMPADSSTPRAIVSTLDRILLGSVLPLDARRRWMGWMESNVVGGDRLRASFPAGWRSGDRTGTADGICNDYAFAYRPDEAVLLVAAYYVAPHLGTAEQEAVLREVGAVVVNRLGEHGSP